ncbi:hypothetical protein LPTSP3_g25440 [Leptospira kobayashii]|uniref:Yip1 domain protein n=1 Tax=Leptospira kobayashii TaxID=1917830 RepID=A0ABN6KGG9_9LEPT|nr:hypothetical protein [Leptospira kobayashii]BDA79614.1 hypothetical protein LPTSP3_g25440 [Leptospira kobayashii]
MSFLKRIVSPAYHIQNWKNIVKNPIIEYDKNTSPREVFRIGLRYFLYFSFTYMFFYFLLFLCAYPYYSKLNEALQLDFAAKGNSGLSYLLNSYPFNVVYVFSALIIFIFYITVFSYYLAKFLESDDRSFLAHFGICLHSTAGLITVLFIVLIVNSIFPFSQPVGYVFFGLLIAAWMILFGIGIYLSARIFIKASNEYFGHNKRRAGLTWLVPLFLFCYFVFGILTA